MQMQKISILPMWMVFLFCTPIPPENSKLASYFASKILTFKTPLRLGISKDLTWGGYRFFHPNLDAFCPRASHIMNHAHIRQQLCMDGGIGIKNELKH